MAGVLERVVVAIQGFLLAKSNNTVFKESVCTSGRSQQACAFIINASSGA